MSIKPPHEEDSTPDLPGEQASSAAGATPPAPIERSKFGGTPRRHERAFDDDAPVSRSDLSKGPQDVLEAPTARINWRVLLVSSMVIIAFSLWAILGPNEARTAMKIAVDWIATNLGWYYVLTMTLVIGFVVWVAF